MLFLSSGIAEFHDIFGRQVAFDINHGSLAFTRIAEEDKAVVAIAQGCHHVIAAHHLAILHHLSDLFRRLAVGLQIVGYFRGMVLIYQALVYLEFVTFELRILHRNHLASLGMSEALEYAFTYSPSWALAEIEATTIRSSPMKKRFIKLHRFIFYTLLYILYFIV